MLRALRQEKSSPEKCANRRSGIRRRQLSRSLIFDQKVNYWAYERCVTTSKRIMPVQFDVSCLCIRKWHGRAFFLTMMLLSVASAVRSQQPASDSAAQKQPQKVAPCRASEYRQFDFWVGDWDVHSPGGPSVGHNLVTLEQDGCLIVEHWTSLTGGNTGTSFNYFDVRDKKWHQLYIDNSGNAGNFPAMAGNFVDGKMTLITDETQTAVFRWTWYQLGSGKVRQMAEQSNDGQKTWKIIWDSQYEKVRPTALKP